MAGGTTVNTLVFIDLETTGLNDPDITELFMLAIGREQFMSESEHKVQNSLKLVFKPGKEIERIAQELTGMCAEDLKDQEGFNKRTTYLLNMFISRLNKPVCLLAHNGKRFDFRILKDSINKSQGEIMPDLLCADTLDGFKVIEQKRDVEKRSYKLGEIYKRTFPDAEVNAHHADSDVHMMYEIALKYKGEFLIWLDNNTISL